MLHISLFSASADFDDGIRNDGDDAVHGDHNDHSDNTPDHMLDSLRAGLFVVQIPDKLHQTPDEDRKRGGEEDEDERVDDVFADAIQQLR